MWLICSPGQTQETRFIHHGNNVCLLIIISYYDLIQILVANVFCIRLLSHVKKVTNFSRSTLLFHPPPVHFFLFFSENITLSTSHLTEFLSQNYFKTQFNVGSKVKDVFNSQCLYVSVHSCNLLILVHMHIYTYRTDMPGFRPFELPLCQCQNTPPPTNSVSVPGTSLRRYRLSVLPRSGTGLGFC